MEARGPHPMHLTIPAKGERRQWAKGLVGFIAGEGIAPEIMTQENRERRIRSVGRIIMSARKK